MLDSGATLANQSIEICLEGAKLETIPLLAGVYCDSEGLSEPNQTPSSTSAIQNLETTDFDSVESGRPFGPRQPVLKTAVLRAFGGFDESLKGGEKDDLWKRIRRQGYVFAAVPAAGAPYRGGATDEQEVAVEHNASDEGRYGIDVDPREQAAVAAAIFLNKDYHMRVSAGLVGALARLGLKAVVVDISSAYRDEGVRSTAAELGSEILGLSNFLLGCCRPNIAVCFNDWDPVIRSLFSVFHKTGVQTLAIVEDVRDHRDADTGRIREAYRHCDTVVLPGAHDEKYFADSDPSYSGRLRSPGGGDAQGLSRKRLSQTAEQHPDQQQPLLWRLDAYAR